MRKENVKIHKLKNYGDDRGNSYNLTDVVIDFLGEIKDVHSATILSSKIRGNHFHSLKKEAILVIHEDEWLFVWDNGENTTTQSHSFAGSGAAIITVESGSSHAIKNTGKAPIFITAFCNMAYDPHETVKRVLI
jgi:dTDP-4-dehydrorhamnose 3,5-epimerase-like enzyme